MTQPSFGKRLGWRIETFFYDLVCLLLKPFSFNQVSAIGGWIIGSIGPLTSKQKIARTGLKIAFPDASKDEIKSLLKQQWKNTGRTFAEFPILHRLDVRDGNDRVKVIGGDILQDIIKHGKPVVIVTGHFANWEVMAMVLTQWGLDVQITYRPINNPHIDRRVRRQREAYGTKLMVPKSGPKGAKELVDALKRGESIALLNDQKFNQGIAIPFFGVDAMTAPGPTRLSLASGAPILPLSLARDKANFTMTVHDLIELKNTGNRNKDVEEGVRRINKFIEDRVRKNPTQWFWVHRRWPKEHYRAD
ncbi:MAG: lysophospholipid acyltransferase family protein [Hellea sp.]|nr:lysophospholipid acyltransferase family protein [Hellea sp.]